MPQKHIWPAAVGKHFKAVLMRNTGYRAISRSDLIRKFLKRITGPPENSLSNVTSVVVFGVWHRQTQWTLRIFYVRNKISFSSESFYDLKILNSENNSATTRINISCACMQLGKYIGHTFLVVSYLFSLTIFIFNIGQDKVNHTLSISEEHRVFTVLLFVNL